MFYDEIRSYYRAGDHGLAYRRLIDAALDTRQPAVFRELLRYADWLDGHSEHGHTAEAVTRALQVLDVIETAGMGARQSAGATAGWQGSPISGASPPCRSCCR